MSDDDPVTRREFAAFAKLMDERKDSQKEALRLAQNVQDAKFEQVNNLREQVNIERGRYVTTEKFEGAAEGFNRSIGALELFRANFAGRIWGIGALIVVLTLMINGLGLYLQAHK